MKALFSAAMVVAATLLFLCASPAMAGPCDGSFPSGALCGNPGPGPGAPVPDSTFPGTHTWTGDALFASGEPWCDPRAKGAAYDGVTDDRAAWQLCVTALIAKGGGLLKAGPGVSCIKSGGGVTVGTGAGASIRIVGDATYASIISACGADTTIFTLNGFYDTIENVTICGKGACGDAGTFGATQPVVVFNSQCGTCMLRYANIQGGSVAFYNNGAPEIRIEESSIVFSYGGAVAYIVNASAPKIFTSSFDKSWPVSLPAAATITTWQPGTTYASGVLVSLGGYIWQANHPGTSGGSAFPFKNYGFDAPDGTSLTWQLVGPVTQFGIQLDTGTSEGFFTTLDLTGAYTAGLAMTNTQAGTPPFLVHVRDTVFSISLLGGIYAHDGHDLYVSTSELFGCVQLQCATTSMFGGWTGNVSFTNNLIAGANAAGIAWTSGNRGTFHGNIFQSNLGGDFYVNNVSSWAFVGNVGASALIAAGTADHFDILGNTGFAITNASSGTHYTICGNDGTACVINGSVVAP